MQTHLFIGGSQDGLNVPVTDEMESVQLPVGDGGQETYVRDTFYVGCEPFVFYRHESLTPDEVLDLLARHYVAWADLALTVKRPDEGR